MGESEEQIIRYSVKGNDVVLENGEKLSYSIKNNQLTISDGSSNLILNKVK